MKYYVWLEYFLDPPKRNLKSSELCYHTGHQHGVRPTPAQIDSLQPDLNAEVSAAATKAGVLYPGDDAVRTGREVKTRSAH